jgi:hypothetical protein
VAVCESGLNIFYHHRRIKNSSPSPTHRIFFFFNLYFLMYRKKTPSLLAFLPSPPLAHNAISQSCVFTIHSSASLKNCLFYYIFHSDIFLGGCDFS